MRTVNRAAFIVRPREPYLEWAANVDDDAADAANALHGRCSVYLVPEDPRGEAETSPLADVAEQIFEMELKAWYLDRDRWPKTRDIETFERWFDVSGESLVVDLATTALEVEEM
jgi:hypothetical protein